MARIKKTDDVIDVTKTTLGGALRASPLCVPNYQREYSWSKERVRKLFDDFHHAMVKQQSSYFMGTIVLTPGDPPNIIDGQQRLATTSIFLSAVRDAFLELGKESEAKSIEDDFLRVYNRQLHEHIPRLTLNTDDREYMRSRVLDRPRDRPANCEGRLHSQRLIDQASRIAADRVALIIGNADALARKVDALNEWVDFIDKSAVVVLLTPPSMARAYQMFKTLNDRAQKTTPADMIKCHLFEQASDRDDEAQSKWSTMRSAIEGASTPREDDPILTYLHHIAIIKYGHTTSDEIFELMEQRVVGHANALRFLEDLANRSNDYVAIVTPTHAKWAVGYDQRIRGCIEDISREIGMKFILPLMLAIAYRFSQAEAYRAFNTLVAWSVRFMITSAHRSGVVERAFGEAARAIAAGEIKTATELIQAAGHVVPNDTKFRSQFCMKTISNSRQARFLLRELESQMRSGPDTHLEAVSDPSKLSLEHLLPKNQAAARGWGHFAPDERRGYCHRIGNMTLLNSKDNGAIGDKPFTEKRPVIERSRNLRITNDVLDRTEGLTNWTKEHINERQAMMAELAIQRWPLKPY